MGWDFYVDFALDYLTPEQTEFWRDRLKDARILGLKVVDPKEGVVVFEGRADVSRLGATLHEFTRIFHPDSCYHFYYGEAIPSSTSGVCFVTAEGPEHFQLASWFMARYEQFRRPR